MTSPSTAAVIVKSGSWLQLPWVSDLLITPSDYIDCMPNSNNDNPRTEYTYLMLIINHLMFVVLVSYKVLFACKFECVDVVGNCSSLLPFPLPPGPPPPTLQRAWRGGRRCELRCKHWNRWHSCIRQCLQVSSYGGRNLISKETFHTKVNDSIEWTFIYKSK